MHSQASRECPKMPHAVSPSPQTARLRRASRRKGFPLGQALKRPHTPLQTLKGALQTQSTGFLAGEGVKPFLHLKPQGACFAQTASALSGKTHFWRSFDALSCHGCRMSDTNNER